MNSRQYLVEDLEQILRYFPGAKPIALRTPFDLTPHQTRQITDVFRAEQSAQPWGKSLRWMN